MLLKVGDKAPEFSLLNQDEELISSKKLEGQKYVLWFYPKASTPGWTIQGQGFRDELKSFLDLGIKVFGVSADSVKKQKNFHTKQKFNFDLLSDENKEIIKKYKVWGKKQFMGREFMGLIRSTFLIDKKGKIIKIWKNVKVKNHAKEVLETLKDVTKKKPSWGKRVFFVN